MKTNKATKAAMPKSSCSAKPAPELPSLPKETADEFDREEQFLEQLKPEVLTQIAVLMDKDDPASKFDDALSMLTQANQFLERQKDYLQWGKHSIATAINEANEEERYWVPNIDDSSQKTNSKLARKGVRSFAALRERLRGGTVICQRMTPSCANRFDFGHIILRQSFKSPTCMKTAVVRMDG